MKVNGKFLKRAFATAVLMLATCLAQAAYDSGSTGADGAFNPTVSTAIQTPESGVFNFTSVNIPAGVTITFLKNSRNTPVTIRAPWDVTIAGTLDVAAGNTTTQFPGNSGPGGFSGGSGGAPGKSGLRGEGPGGGGGGIYGGSGSGCGGGAGFGLDGNAGATYNSSTGGVKGTLYGNEQILPLMGGSGGGGGSGSSNASGGGGGGGGGSILIASSGTITVSGTIRASGGNGVNGEAGLGGGGGGGSGGSIRLICETLAGNGSITAVGGTYGTGYTGGGYYGGNGSAGRIRLEYNNKTRSAVTTPAYTYGIPAPVVPTTTPTLTIQSIGGADVPATSQGLMNAPDVNLPWGTANPINIVVKGANIPVGTTITIKASPSVGTAVTGTGTLAGIDADSSVTIPISIATAYPSVITVTCTYTVIASNGSNPIYAGGERVDKVRVASVVGGGSSITYITESGREVPAVM